MEVGGYWQEGRWVQGATVKTAGDRGTSGLELEVAAACARCTEGVSDPADELRELIKRYPTLKLESRGEEVHPLTPLAKVLAYKRLGT